MEDAIKKVVIYTDIDSVIDTRLDTVMNYIDPKEIDIHKWTTRDTLSGGILPYGIFDKLHERRVERKPAPLLTNIPAVISALVASIRLELDGTMLPYSIDIVLNTHPYILDTSEMDVLINLFTDKLNAPVTIVEDKDKAKHILSADYALCVDGLKELNKLSSFNSECRLTTPAITLTDTPIDKDTVEQLRYGLSPMIGLDPIHISHFSLTKLKLR